MSSINKGLRRVGIVGLSTLVAASMMTLSATTASATAGDYVAVTAPNVAQGTTTAVGNVTLAFANDFAAGSKQTFQIKRGGAANVCTTASGVAAAIGFNAAPTVGFGTVLNAAGTAAGTAANAATAGAVVLSSSTAACLANSIKDVATVTMTSASTAPLTDTWKATLTVGSYVVGATAAAGPVALVTAGDLVTGPASVNNANVVLVSHTDMPIITAQTGSLGNTLGKVTFTETTAGAFFDANATVVTLHLSAGTFTDGVTPTITVPTGYVVNPVVHATTGSSADYVFDMDVPATLTTATVSVSGLKLDAPTTGAGLVSLTADTDSAAAPAPVALDAAKYLDYGARTGGSDRYATAAALFNEGAFGATTAVLASGVNFPDALSGNYLAGQLGTGILLTAPSSLSPAARGAILSNDVSTVYIVGQTGAVSQNVQNQIEALRVGGISDAPFITVVRLGGADRYATNKIINESDFATSDTVLLASGSNFPDALALGPISYNKAFPLILTRGTTLGATETAQLADFSPSKVVIAGGVGVVSAGIATSLTTQGMTVTRLWGNDRTQTAAAVATWGTLTAQGFHSDTTWIARGDDFADALAAGPVVGDSNQMIVLSLSPTALGAGIPSYLGSKAVGTADDQVGILHALGQTGATSVALMKSAAATVGLP